MLGSGQGSGWDSQVRVFGGLCNDVVASSIHQYLKNTTVMETQPEYPFPGGHLPVGPAGEDPGMLNAELWMEVEPVEGVGGPRAAGVLLETGAGGRLLALLEAPWWGRPPCGAGVCPSWIPT